MNNETLIKKSGRRWGESYVKQTDDEKKLKRKPYISKKKIPIAVIDFETDPFKHGSTVAPFAAGFFDGEIYKDFWGDDCVDQLCNYLDSREPLLIYAHNGGKFDFMFLLWAGKIDNPVFIIDGRIVKCPLGKHELRDSFAAMPVALSKFNKEVIDYEIMKKSKRNIVKNKKAILEYLESDCRNLHAPIVRFTERFGRKLTVGSAAITQLEKLHPVIRMNERHDNKFRPYYFGGRVECFETGEIKGNLKIYDVNSMYPSVMKNFDHPIGGHYIEIIENATDYMDLSTGKLKRHGELYFAEIECEQRGALPKATFNSSGTKDGIDFNSVGGTFFVCSHELITGIELGLVKVHKVRRLHIPCRSQRYIEYVDKFTNEKIEAKKSGDIAGELFAKFMSNSAYGKFGTNPSLFKDWFILDRSNEKSCRQFDKWFNEAKENEKFPELHTDHDNFQLWSCRNPSEHGYYDVAIAASITSAARSVLLRAIHNAYRPVYCDTDSLICEGLNVEIDATKLGAWKFEGSGKKIYIGGKKLYSMKTDQVDKEGNSIYKTASKGVKLSHAEIVRICEGETVEWKSEAPNFKMSGEQKYTVRKIKKRC